MEGEKCRKMKREREDRSGKKWGGGKKGRLFEKGRYRQNDKGGRRRRRTEGGEKKDQIQKRGHNMVMAARVTEIESGE